MTDKRVKWHPITVDRWYNELNKELQYTTGVSVWSGSRKSEHALLRWVLVKDPTGSYEPALFGCSDQSETSKQIIQEAVNRWGVEVTFEEGRRHLGLESQRQWSRLAIARTTPVLLALKSIICLLAEPIYKADQLVTNAAAWYKKDHITFSDILASVQTQIWQSTNYVTRGSQGVVRQLKQQLAFMRGVLTLALA